MSIANVIKMVYYKLYYGVIVLYYCIMGSQTFNAVPCFPCSTGCCYRWPRPLAWCTKCFTSLHIASLCAKRLESGNWHTFPFSWTDTFCARALCSLIDRPICRRKPKHGLYCTLLLWSDRSWCLKTCKSCQLKHSLIDHAEVLLRSAVNMSTEVAYHEGASPKA